MTKPAILLIAAAASVLLPSVSNAACTTFGQVTRVTVPSTSASVLVRASTTNPSNTYVFTTSNILQLTAALTAQASHQQVRVDGNRASCSGVVGGTIIGGVIVTISVSP